MESVHRQCIQFAMAPWVHWEAGADPSCPLVKAGSILDKFPVDHEVWNYSQVFTLAHLIQLPSRCNRTALSVIASVVIWSLNSKLTEKKRNQCQSCARASIGRCVHACIATIYIIRGKKKTVFLNITNKHFYRSDCLKS